MPKPHTPFQWAGQASAETIDHRLRMLRQKINEDRRIGRSIGLRYHDGKPGVIEGLLSRGDRRVGRVIERVWRDGGKFDGWSEHFSFDRWTAAARRGAGALRRRPRLVHHPRAHRARGPALGPPGLRAWTRSGSGTTGRRRSAEEEVADCRWTPCYDCGVCPTMGTEIQIGPTGRSLLPLTVV